MKKPKTCRYCQTELDKDSIGLNKKLFDEDAKRGNLTCVLCMAEVLECSVDDLLAKIEEFKAEGCKLFL